MRDQKLDCSGVERCPVVPQFSEPIHGTLGIARAHIAEPGERLDSAALADSDGILNTARVLPPWSLPKNIQLPRLIATLRLTPSVALRYRSPDGCFPKKVTGKSPRWGMTARVSVHLRQPEPARRVRKYRHVYLQKRRDHCATGAEPVVP